MNISRKGLVLGLCVLALVLCQAFAAPTNETTKTQQKAPADSSKKDDVVVNITESEKGGLDEIDESIIDEDEKDNETEGFEPDNRLVACSLLLFLKIKKDEQKITEIMGKDKAQKKIREPKLKGLILNKCNTTLPNNLVEKVTNPNINK